jgi:uncharacterized membrane protein
MDGTTETSSQAPGEYVSTTTRLSWEDIVIVVLYFIAVIVVGLYVGLLTYFYLLLSVIFVYLIRLYG